MLSFAVATSGALLQSPLGNPTPAQQQQPFAGFASRLQSGVTAAALAATLSLGGGVSPAAAMLGTNLENIPLTVQSYAEITCPEALAQGRAGGALGAGAGGAGIAQKCVRVEAVAENPSKIAFDDVGVFGVVTEKKTTMSVLGNGQDGKNDAGQLAMVDKIPPGKSVVDFVFVSQQSTDCRNSRYKNDEGKLVEYKCPVAGTEPLVELQFEKMKAVSYPGGDRYKGYDECEQNEFAEVCAAVAPPSPP